LLSWLKDEVTNRLSDQDLRRHLDDGRARLLQVELVVELANALGRRLAAFIPEFVWIADHDSSKMLILCEVELGPGFG
jgi:hypothetical protein